MKAVVLSCSGKCRMFKYTLKKPPFRGGKKKGLKRWVSSVPYFCVIYRLNETYLWYVVMLLHCLLGRLIIIALLAIFN